MPKIIDYARQDTRRGSRVVPAFVVSLCSGPAAFGFLFGLAGLGGSKQLSEQAKESLLLLSLAAVLGASFVFACVVRFRLQAGAAPWSRAIANIAVAAPLVWAIAFAVLIAYLLRHFAR